MRAMTTLPLAALLALTGGAAAQQVPAVLTLQDALRIARENNPDYRKALNDLGVSAMAVRRAWAAFLPDLRSSMNFSGSSSTSARGEGDFGQPVQNPEPITFRSSSARQGASLGFTLFDGGGMFRRLSAARADQQAVESAVSLAESNLDAQIAREFYDARRTALLVEVELRNLQNARRRLEDSEERFRIAAISQVDLLDAQRSLIGVEQALALAEANAEKARFALRQTLGLDASIPFEVAEEMPEVFDPSTLDAAALVTRALQQSPSVRQRLAAVEAARQNAAAARGARWPTISGGLGYDRSTSEDGYGAFGELNPNGRYGYSFSISVSFPLFTRFQTSQQIAQADAGREDAEQDLRRTRLDIERTIRSGLVDLGRWFRNFEAQQQIAALTQQQVELAEEQFRLGAMNFLQFQQVVDNNATAQRNAVDARFQFVAARLGLEQALGGPLGR